MSHSHSDGSGSKFFDPGRAGRLIFSSSGQVGTNRLSHLWFGFGFGKFPLKTLKNLIFFPFGSKQISLGRVKKYPDQRRVSLLYIKGQKYAKVGSGHISTLTVLNLQLSCLDFNFIYL